MNLAAEAPVFIVVMLALLLCAAAIEDMVRFRISNLTSVGILILAGASAAIVGLEWNIWKNLAVFSAVLLVGTLLFAAGKFGGGDVKLLAASALWFNFLGALKLLSAVFISGGILAVIIIAARGFASDGMKERVAVLRPKAGIPYGVAVAIGTVIALTLERLAPSGLSANEQWLRSLR
jgi:prepilin peptidase CpaA